MFNLSFLPMDSTNSNVHFHFDVLLNPRLLCFEINSIDTRKDATNETHAFCAMDDHVEIMSCRSCQSKQK